MDRRVVVFASVLTLLAGQYLPGADASRDLAPQSRVLLQDGADTLKLSTLSEYTTYPGSSQRISAIVRIQAPTRSDRAPLSITAVLDRSGSMDGEKISLLKKTAEFLAVKLQPKDSMGVVSYSSDVEVDSPLALVTDGQRAQIRSKVQAIVAAGNTNLAGGLFEAIQQQRNADVGNDSFKAILLFTDGLANEGLTDVGDIVVKMHQELDDKLPPTVFTLGFGADHDVDFMKAIATAGRGDYIFIKDAASIAPVFGELLGGLITVAAQNININLTPQNGTFITAIQTGGIVQGSESNWTVIFDNLFAEEERDILVDMSVPTLDSAAAAQKVLQVDISYFDPVSRASIVLDPVFLVIDRTLGERAADDSLNLDVEVARLTFLVSKEIQRALEQKEAFDVTGAIATLDALLTRISISPARDDPQVLALKSDVERVRELVAAEEPLEDAEALDIASSAAGVGSQRAAAGSNFSSAPPPPPTSAAFAVAAESFVAEAPL